MFQVLMITALVGLPHNQEPAIVAEIQKLGGTAIVESGDVVSIDFRGSNITDEALQYLSRLKSLEVLHLQETDITPEGAETLRKALPKCVISSG